MELEYKGGTCVVLTHKKEQIFSDPHISPLGLKDQGVQAAVHILTEARFRAPASDQTVVIDGPGEYEVHNCSIWGIAATPHIMPEGVKSSTVYRLDLDGTSVALIGHITKLDDSQLEALGMVDILVLPVGGFGYTLEPKQAVDLVKAIEPKIVVPIHYADPHVSYEVPQAPLEDFLKELGAVAEEPQEKLRLKGGILPDKLTVVPLIHK